MKVVEGLHTRNKTRQRKPLRLGPTSLLMEDRLEMYREDRLEMYRDVQGDFNFDADPLDSDLDPGHQPF